MEIKKKPNEIFDEYKKGDEYKASIGNRGIADQAKMNERFYVGDQWHGVQAGNSRPLVRRNIIKRIGEYKISAVCAAPVAVNYSAEGIPNTKEMQDAEKDLQNQLMQGEIMQGAVTDEEINVIMETLTAYNKATAERVKFGELANELTKCAYISGTAFLYTYWDESVETGLFADDAKTTAITGDINCEILNVVNVILGDPNCKEIQKQPYIIVSQRKPLSEVKREAEANKKSIKDITADTESATYNAGDWGENEPEDNNRVTVLTKFWKEYDKKTGKHRIKAIKVTEKAVIRDEWDLKLRLYPFAKFTWLPRFSSGYGDSEITYLIPNQIAINRALSAAVWSAMLTGMPKMVVNSDLIHEPVTNDPGQIIKLASSGEYDVQKAISYINPPQFAGQLQNIVADIANNTLSDMGANDAALGNIRPDNASAIIAMREAALQPMQIYQNTYYSCVEEIARIWADFWLNMYGNRPLRVEDKDGTRYVPFDAERYKNIVVNARVDVGASTLWGESVVISTLSNLLNAGIITPAQFLERVPKGLIPDVTGLIDEMKAQQTATQNEEEETLAQFAQQYPDQYQAYLQMPESEKAKIREQLGVIQ
ncbi:MAG: hypothetical protein E7365_06030 [Clostridiales bacterium]|nr:hypothetical protein [Clostridiales bacterium]